MPKQNRSISLQPSTRCCIKLGLLLHDIRIAREIIAITSTKKKAMKSVKSLGRKVRNFDDVVWKPNRKRIVLEGNLLKFRQHEDLKQKLLATGDTEIAEAAPGDRICGIGFGEKNALAKYDKWALNLLGKTLAEVRKVLREEEADNSAPNQSCKVSSNSKSLID